MKTKQIHHPEQQPDEIYMGNTHGKPVTAWQTVRIGKQAYDIYNMSIIQGLSPWFIKRKEVEDCIASSTNIARNHILQQMLDY